MENQKRTEKEYMAFVSYQHDDLEFAKWLQYQMEHYRLPSSVVEENPEIDYSPFRVFVDKTELSTGILGDEIEHALRESHFLIVLCSPSSAKSEWVDKEIRKFLKWNGRDSVIPMILSGVPYSEGPDTECYPPALCELRRTENEILGINVADFGREVSSIKAIAYMLGIKFDRLWQRYERDKEKEQQRLAEERSRLLRLQSLFLAEKAMAELAEGNLSTARFLALKALPTDLDNPDRPLVPEAENALRRSMGTQRMAFDCKCEVTSAVFTQDGGGLFIGGYDRCVVMRELPGGNIINKADKNSRVHRVRISPDGSKVVVATYDGPVIFDANGKKLKALDRIIRGACLDATFTPDMKSLIMASAKGYIGVYDLESSELKFNVEAAENGINSISVNQEGTLLASAQRTDYVSLWDLPTITLRKSLKFEGENINSVNFSPSSNSLLVTSDTGSVRLIDADTYKVLWTNTSSEKAVRCGAFSHDGKLVAVGSNDGILRILNTLNGSTKKIYILHADAINSVSFDSTGSLVATASADKTVQVVQLKEDESLPNVQKLKINGLCPTYNPSNHSIAVIEQTLSKIKVYGKYGRMESESLAAKDITRAIRYSHRSDMLVALAAGEDIKLMVWDAKTMKLQRVINCEKHKNHDVRYRYNSYEDEEVDVAPAPVYDNGMVRFSPDDSMVAFSWGGIIDIYKSVSGQHVKKIMDLNGTISDFVFDKTGDTLIVAMQNGFLNFRNLKTGKNVAPVKFEASITLIDLHQEGDKIAVALKSKKSVAIYSISQKKVIMVIEPHTTCKAVRYINDGTQLVVAGDALEVYDAATGARIHHIGNDEVKCDIVNIIRTISPGMAYLAMSSGTLCKLYSPVKKSLADLIQEAASALESFELSPRDRARFYLDV